MLIQPEVIATELQKLVGWGATWKKLPLMPGLRVVLGAPDDIPFKDTGQLMQRRLKRAISSLPGEHFEWMGKRIPIHDAKIAFRWALWIDGPRDSVERRNKVMQLLRECHSVGHWRKEPEWIFMLRLAEALCPNEIHLAA